MRRWILLGVLNEYIKKQKPIPAERSHPWLVQTYTPASLEVVIFKSHTGSTCSSCYASRVPILDYQQTVAKKR